MLKKERPKYINLLTLAPKMSITAKISILHRLSGFLLFLSIPFILYILHRSLTNPDFYSAFYSIISAPIIKIIYLILILGFIYHLCAGVRFLFLDIHKGVEINMAKKTAWVTLVISILLTVVLGVMIW